MYTSIITFKSLFKTTLKFVANHASNPPTMLEFELTTLGLTTDPF